MAARAGVAEPGHQFFEGRTCAKGRVALTTYLDEAEAAGGLWRWYPGNNGIPGRLPY